MATIEPYAAKGVFDPPIYSQAVKVTGAQTILYIAGQVAYDDKGNPAHVGDFKSQARAVLTALKTRRPAEVRCDQVGRADLTCKPCIAFASVSWVSAPL